MKKIGFIGYGNIASAIIFGAIASGKLKSNQINCYDTDKNKLKKAADEGVGVACSAKELAINSDVLFLTVKPQIFPVVIEGIKDSLKKETLVVTPAAGIKLEKVNRLFGFKVKAIRVMPNTPLMYLQGASALVRGEGVTDDEFEFVMDIFNALGTAVTVTEDKIDAVTGISGSSPAFFMRFAKAIIQQGVELGINHKQAEELVIQTMMGTAKMMRESGKTADELIKAVASPAGTTEAGLNKMTELNTDQSVKEIIKAAVNRSVELSE